MKIISQIDSKELLVIAKNAAKSAGDFLDSSKEIMRQVDMQSRRDVKIRGDQESEMVILNYLREKTQIPILSEEIGQALDKGDSNIIRWIVDPLDGSLNYSRGITLCCISIGLWQGDKPVLGVVYDFNNNEMFSGIVGEEAWLNDHRIRVSTNSKQEDSVLCTGFPVNTDFSPDAIETFVENIRSYKKVRLLGSAALSLAYVASGRADAYYEKNIMIWDIAGGLAIMVAAGGEYSLESGCIANSYKCWGSNSIICNSK